MSAFVYRACARDTRSWDTLAWPGFIRYLPAQRQIKNYTSNYPARYRKPNAVYHLPITRPTDSESRLFPPTWLVTVSRRNSIVNCRKIDREKCFCSFRIFASFVRPLDSSRSGDTSSRNSIIEPTTRNSHGLSNLIQHSRAARMFYSNSSQLRSERCTHPRSPPLATARSMINRRSRTNLVSGFYSRSYLFFSPFSQVFSSLTIRPSNSSFLSFFFSI